MRRKFELDNGVGSVGRLKNKIVERNKKDWEEELYLKSTLKWYKLEKDGTRVAKYVISSGSEDCEVVVQAKDLFSWVVGG